MKAFCKFNSFRILFIFSILLLLVLGCKEDNPTQSTPEPPITDNSAVLVNYLNVALVQGGTQTVCVTTIDKDGNPESFTVTSGNTSIASVIKVDTTFTSNR